jgi:hypothetical protein
MSGKTRRKDQKGNDFLAELPITAFDEIKLAKFREASLVPL